VACACARLHVFRLDPGEKWGKLQSGGAAKMPKTVQNLTYAALIVVLFGTATGWLGGL